MILLGSTGSIGVNALEIARRFSLNVEVLVAGRNVERLAKQVAEFAPDIVVVAQKEDVHKINHPQVLWGEAGVLEAIERAKSDFMINALVGFLGLRPTLKAIALGKKIALANKESLVAGGAFVDVSNIQPIDSEHFGLWYLLQNKSDVAKMIITASGGAFRDWPLEELHQAGLQDALKHPNWEMGQKITIDSASMVNKLFELLEARWLFGEGTYDAIMEPKSLIHALIDFKDGSTTAHFAYADMKLPIAHAILGEVNTPILKPVNLLEVGHLEFREIKAQRYPIWEIKEDILKHPERGVIVNAANEAAIEQFVAGKIGFLDISRRIIEAYHHFDVRVQSVDDIFSIDTAVREYIGV
ncbi:MAG TPA: 1-deoxy-D-xylulose-5-phosphate reductoisomerase [Helicobacteraceae bacterium]|nr:1-deoxy-D-xylulose-5-phosphate reductoisomerase [Helicobacteraceae bacterium]